MKPPSSDLDPAVQQLVEAFNQALLHQADTYFQDLRQLAIVRHCALVNEVETEIFTRKPTKRTTLPALLQRALSRASTWLIDDFAILEAEQTTDVPLPDGNDVIVIDANYTVISPERKETDHGPTYSLEPTECLRATPQTRSGATQPENQPEQQQGHSSYPRGSTPAPDGGECDSHDFVSRATGN